MADPIVGTENPDSLEGTKGNDTITALGGGDSIRDYGGDDSIDGGSGNDYLYYFTKNLGITVDLAVTDAQNTGGAGTDTLTSIENVYAGTGTGNDNLSGTEGANWLFSFQGDDTLLGRGGDDWLMTADGVKVVDGGSGTDTYTFNTVKIGSVFIGATISLALQGQAQVSGTLTITLSGIENLGGSLGEDSLTGDNGVNKLAGGNGDDQLFGGGNSDILAGDGVFQYDEFRNFTFYPVIGGPVGNDFLDGGRGADTMYGGLGNDTYVVDNLGDLVIEDADGGNDTVRLLTNVPAVFAIREYTLGNNIENLEAQTDLRYPYKLTGNGLNNTITGGKGDEEIDGGIGADTMIGGAGNDTYRVDNTADKIIEVPGAGYDTVISSVSYVLSDNVDNLYLYLGGKNATGNARNNSLAGNALDNVLDGQGGVDTMEGGAGDDTYVVDDKRDRVIEDGSVGYTGNDTVRSSVSYTLGAYLDILRLTGTANLNGTGNTLSNEIYGNDGNNVLDGGGGGDRLVGGRGDDTYIVHFQDRVVENADGGIDTVKSGGSYFLGANLENLIVTGTADAELRGNALANVITGNAGNDSLDGLAGGDTMIGGAGDDRYFVDNIGDKVIERRGGGLDTVTSTIDFSLADSAVEHLILVGKNAQIGTGNALDNTILGTDFANTLDGGAGDDELRGANGDDTLLGGAGNDFLDAGSGTDILDGGAGNDRLAGNRGIDQMSGGTGDDIFYVENVKDVVIENADEGRDVVNSTVDYVLSANVEDLVLSGNAAINGTGNALANTITGNDADNVLDGGTGADRLIGGGGTDIFVVDNAGDKIEGTGTIRASVSYTLVGDYTLELIGNSAINATGNNLANTITGNAFANTIIGAGGNDVIDGGGGNDTLRGDDGVDSLTGGTGNDLILGGADGDALEGGAGDDTLRGDQGADSLLGGAGKDLLVGGADADTLDGGEGDDTLRGDDGADRLLGGAGNDTLTGGAGGDRLNGGAGADTMDGGAGGDFYTVDNIADKVSDSGAAEDGFDTVYTSVNYVAGSGIEVISAALNGPGINPAIDITGNALDNFIVGTNGANRIDGGAGNDVILGLGGADTLIGGTGDDFIANGQTATGGDGADKFAFAFNFANEPFEAVETVTDFVHGTDRIVVTIDFAPSPPSVSDGPLVADSFVLGTAALDVDDRVIYDTATGRLWLDADGNGARAAQLVANLGAGTVLGADDIEGLTFQSFFVQNQASYIAAFGFV